MPITETLSHPDVWMTNDGRVLTMKEIEDQHLLNIIRFLKGRQLKTMTEGLEALCYIQREMAQDAVEHEMSITNAHYQEQINMFTGEARNRGLTTSL